MSRRHPVLSNVYRNMRPSDKVLFVDESYSAPQPGRQSFYITAGALLKLRDLEDTRADLRDIVGGDWWHTTDSLQDRDEGVPIVEDLLDYCSRHADPMFIAHKLPLSNDSDVEAARQLCLAGLLTHVNSQMSAVVIEPRQYLYQNDADRALMKRLRRSGDVKRSTPAVHVSPREEQLLWLPDLVAMTYRRQITHNDETSTYFETYLSESTTTIDLESYTLADRDVPGQSLIARIVGNTMYRSAALDLVNPHIEVHSWREDSSVAGDELEN